MQGTQLPEDVLGAFVSVYVGADHIRDAMDKAERSLLEDRYKPIRIWRAEELDLFETDYDTDAEGYPSNSDLVEIMESGGIWYGPFDTFYREDELTH